MRNKRGRSQEVVVGGRGQLAGSQGPPKMGLQIEPQPHLPQRRNYLERNRSCIKLWITVKMPR